MVGGWVEGCLGRGIVDAEGHVALRLLEVKQMGNLDVIDGGGSGSDDGREWRGGGLRRG